MWDGDVEVGFKWTRKWVEKGEMVFPRTGHVSGIINGGDIWSCGGATSGEINPDTEQVTFCDRKRSNSKLNFLKAYGFTIYRTGNDFLTRFPEHYSGLDKHEITRKLWARNGKGWG